MKDLLLKTEFLGTCVVELYVHEGYKKVMQYQISISMLVCHRYQHIDKSLKFFDSWLTTSRAEANQIFAIKCKEFEI